MSLPPTYDLSFVSGDTFSFDVRVQDPDPVQPWITNPRDLTGWTAAAQIRKAPGAPEVLATFSVGALGPDGVITLTLPPAESQPLGPLTAAAWDLQLTSPEGVVKTILRGAVKPVQDVTRD